MRGLQYLSDNTGNKSILLIDLKQHDKSLDELIEDLMDVMECGTLKDEPTVSFEEVITNLYKKGKIGKKSYQQLLAE